MYKNNCRHCHAEIECESKKLFANHVRWCNPDQDNTKYIVKCSCLECRKETTVQSLKSHLKKHDDSKIVKSNCEHCGKEIFKKNTRFCSQSCVAHYSNSVVDRTKFKPGPVDKLVGPKIPPHILKARNEGRNDPVTRKYKTSFKKSVTVASWITFCKCCGTLFKRKSEKHDKQYCSKDCRMSVIALNRGRHKKSYLEDSFSKWLDSRNIVYETEKTFKNESTGKWYFVDFVFEHLKVIIELDGSHHEKTVEYDTIRDDFLSSLGYTVLRITHKEYQSKRKIEEVCSLLNIL